MGARYFTSFEALQQGLREGDPSAFDASSQLLSSAHRHSRSQIVVFVADASPSVSIPVLQRWFAADWPAQNGAWWVLAYLERLSPSKAKVVREKIAPQNRVREDLHEDVAVQATGWIYEYASHVEDAVAPLSEMTRSPLHSWLASPYAPLALGALQALLALGIPPSKSDAAAVVVRASRAGLRQADVLGVRCGFLESADRLAQQVLEEGPWSHIGVQAFVQVLPDAVRERLRSWRLPRRSFTDRDVHVAAILAAHGDANAMTWLARMSNTSDPRRRAVVWSARVLAVSHGGDARALERLGKSLLRQSEAIRAWVLSTLSPENPIQRAWLEQARRYGTREEKRAVADAMEAWFLRRPLVPDSV